MAALAAPAARRPLAETIRTARREEAANILTVGTIPGTIPGTMSNDQQLARWLKWLASASHVAKVYTLHGRICVSARNHGSLSPQQTSRVKACVTAPACGKQ